MRTLAALISLFAFGGQAYPPPYPRAGTKALIDNARAQVWDVSWPKGQPSGLHRHLYDMTGLYYWPGDRIITAVDKSTRNISTKAGQIQWQLKGITHIEEGTSDDPLRAVMIELKGDGPSHKVEKANGVPAFTGSAMPLLDNERVTVWDYAKAASASAQPPDGYLRGLDRGTRRPRGLPPRRHRAHGGADRRGDEGDHLRAEVARRLPERVGSSRAPPSLDARPAQIAAHLVQHHGGLSLRVALERDLRVDGRVEELGRASRKNLDLRLPGDLREQLSRPRA